jgi:hypothetical protein
MHCLEGLMCLVTLSMSQKYIMLNNTQEIFRGENGHNLIKVLFQNLWMD